MLQMVSNLIENGIKYTVGDERRVKVETGGEMDSVWVRVSDNGPGIPPEDLPHLFDRFYRADKARTRDTEDAFSGSGLGLSIVQSIAHMHGGEVQVDCDHGTGTTFEVRFKTK
jgi:signal transduction histidine kinase